eukprot:422462-Rhodomonas_salina.2
MHSQLYPGPGPKTLEPAAARGCQGLFNSNLTPFLTSNLTPFQYNLYQARGVLTRPLAAPLSLPLCPGPGHQRWQQPPALT